MSQRLVQTKSPAAKNFRTFRVGQLCPTVVHAANCAHTSPACAFFTRVLASAGQSTQPVHASTSTAELTLPPCIICTMHGEQPLPKMAGRLVGQCTNLAWSFALFAGSLRPGDPLRACPGRGRDPVPLTSTARLEEKKVLLG